MVNTDDQCKITLLWLTILDSIFLFCQVSTRTGPLPHLLYIKIIILKDSKSREALTLFLHVWVCRGSPWIVRHSVRMVSRIVGVLLRGEPPSISPHHLRGDVVRLVGRVGGHGIPVGHHGGARRGRVVWGCARRVCFPLLAAVEVVRGALRLALPLALACTSRGRSLTLAASFAIFTTSVFFVFCRALPLLFCQAQSILT